MAYEGNLQIVPGLVAAGDLSDKQYRFGVVGATGVSAASVAGQPVDGVIQDDPDTAGHAVSLANSGTSKVVASGIIAKGARVQTTATGKAVTAAAAASAAFKACSAETYDLDDGDTGVLDTDNSGNETFTFNAATASITDTTAYAVADQDTKNFNITLTGGQYDGEVQPVLFNATTTTALQVAARANAVLKGCSADVVGGQVVITHDDMGTGMDITFDADTSGITMAASVPGTGDAVDASVVTAAEVKTLIEGDTIAEVAVSSGVPTISSPTTGPTSELDFISGTLLAKLGLSVETINGSASGTYYAGKALEAASADGDVISVLLQTGINV